MGVANCKCQTSTNVKDSKYKTKLFPGDTSQLMQQNASYLNRSSMSQGYKKYSLGRRNSFDHRPIHQKLYRKNSMDEYLEWYAFNHLEQHQIFHHIKPTNPQHWALTHGHHKMPNSSKRFNAKFGPLAGHSQYAQIFDENDESMASFGGPQACGAVFSENPLKILHPENSNNGRGKNHQKSTFCRLQAILKEQGNQHEESKELSNTGHFLRQNSKHQSLFEDVTSFFQQPVKLKQPNAIEALKLEDGLMVKAKTQEMPELDKKNETIRIDLPKASDTSRQMQPSQNQSPSIRNEANRNPNKAMLTVNNSGNQRSSENDNNIKLKSVRTSDRSSSYQPVKYNSSLTAPKVVMNILKSFEKKESIDKNFEEKKQPNNSSSNNTSNNQGGNSSSNAPNRGNSASTIEEQSTLCKIGTGGTHQKLGEHAQSLKFNNKQELSPVSSSDQASRITSQNKLSFHSKNTAFEYNTQHGTTKIKYPRKGTTMTFAGGTPVQHEEGDFQMMIGGHSSQESLPISITHGGVGGAIGGNSQRNFQLVEKKLTMKNDQSGERSTKLLNVNSNNQSHIPRISNNSFHSVAAIQKQPNEKNAVRGVSNVSDPISPSVFKGSTLLQDDYYFGAKAFQYNGNQRKRSIGSTSADFFIKQSQTLNNGVSQSKRVSSGQDVNEMRVSTQNGGGGGGSHEIQELNNNFVPRLREHHKSDSIEEEPIKLPTQIKRPSITPLNLPVNCSPLHLDRPIKISHEPRYDSPPSPKIIITRPPEEESKHSLNMTSNMSLDESEKSTLKNQQQETKKEKKRIKNRMNTYQVNIEGQHYLQQLARNIEEERMNRTSRMDEEENSPGDNLGEETSCFGKTTSKNRSMSYYQEQQNEVSPNNNTIQTQQMQSPNTRTTQSPVPCTRQPPQRKRSKNSMPFMVKWVGDQLVHAKSGKVIIEIHRKSNGINGSNDNIQPTSDDSIKDLSQRLNGSRLTPPQPFSKLNQQQIQQMPQPNNGISTLPTAIQNAQINAYSSNIQMSGSPQKLSSNSGFAQERFDNANSLQGGSLLSINNQNSGYQHTQKLPSSSYIINNSLEKISEDDAEKGSATGYVSSNKIKSGNKLTTHGSSEAMHAIPSPCLMIQHEDIPHISDAINFTVVAKSAFSKNVVQNHNSRQEVLQRRQNDTSAQVMQEGRIPQSTITSNNSNDMYLRAAQALLPQQQPTSRAFQGISKTHVVGMPFSNEMIQSNQQIKERSVSKGGLISLVRRQMTENANDSAPSIPQLRQSFANRKWSCHVKRTMNQQEQIFKQDAKIPKRKSFIRPKQKFLIENASAFEPSQKSSENQSNLGHESAAQGNRSKQQVTTIVEEGGYLHLKASKGNGNGKKRRSSFMRGLGGGTGSGILLGANNQILHQQQQLALIKNTSGDQHQNSPSGRCSATPKIIVRKSQLTVGTNPSLFKTLSRKATADASTGGGGGGPQTQISKDCLDIQPSNLNGAGANSNSINQSFASSQNTTNQMNPKLKYRIHTDPSIIRKKAKEQPKESSKTLQNFTKMAGGQTQNNQSEYKRPRAVSRFQQRQNIQIEIVEDSGTPLVSQSIQQQTALLPPHNLPAPFTRTRTLKKPAPQTTPKTPNLIMRVRHPKTNMESSNMTSIYPRSPMLQRGTHVVKMVGVEQLPHQENQMTQQINDQILKAHKLQISYNTTEFNEDDVMSISKNPFGETDSDDSYGDYYDEEEDLEDEEYDDEYYSSGSELDEDQSQMYEESESTRRLQAKLGLSVNNLKNGAQENQLATPQKEQFHNIYKKEYENDGTSDDALQNYQVTSSKNQLQPPSDKWSQILEEEQYTKDVVQHFVKQNPMLSSRRGKTEIMKKTNINSSLIEQTENHIGTPSSNTSKPKNTKKELFHQVLADRLNSINSNDLKDMYTSGAFDKNISTFDNILANISCDEDEKQNCKPPMPIVFQEDKPSIDIIQVTSRSPPKQPISPYIQLQSESELVISGQSTLKEIESSKESLKQISSQKDEQNVKCNQNERKSQEFQKESSLNGPQISLITPTFIKTQMEINVKSLDQENAFSDVDSKARPPMLNIGVSSFAPSQDTVLKIPTETSIIEPLNLKKKETIKREKVVQIDESHQNSLAPQKLHEPSESGPKLLTKSSLKRTRPLIEEVIDPFKPGDQPRTQTSGINIMVQQFTKKQVTLNTGKFAEDQQQSLKTVSQQDSIPQPTVPIEVKKPNLKQQDDNQDSLKTDSEAELYAKMEEIRERKEAQKSTSADNGARLSGKFGTQKILLNAKNDTLKNLNENKEDTKSNINDHISQSSFLAPTISNMKQFNPKKKVPTSKESSYSRPTRSITTHSCISSRKNGKKKINQYIVNQMIGQGKFAKVYRCINEQDQKEYAMKIVSKRKVNRSFSSMNKKAYNFLETEIAILKKLDHPNVLTLYEIIDDPNLEKLYIITDYIKTGNLASRIQKGLTTNDIRHYFRGLIAAVEYCHDYAQVMHRDIKPENILVAEDDQIKLADFGVSQMFENDNDMLTSKAGTSFFFSPELCKGASYHGKPADVWACGVVLFLMSTKRFPFVSHNIQDLYKTILSSQPDFSDIADPRLEDLLRGILKKDYTKRFTISQIKQHPWLTEDGRIPMKRLDSNRIVINAMDLKSVVTRVVHICRIMKNMHGGDGAPTGSSAFSNLVDQLKNQKKDAIKNEQETTTPNLFGFQAQKMQIGQNYSSTFTNKGSGAGALMFTNVVKAAVKQNQAQEKDKSQEQTKEAPAQPE